MEERLKGLMAKILSGRGKQLRKLLQEEAKR